MAEWGKLNRGRKRELNRRWSAKNRSYYVEACADRRARKKQAAPSWADKRVMQDIYLLARIYTTHGIFAHVDHIVPLRSNRVCGLHVPANLTVRTAESNMEKNNLHWPDMPSVCGCA